jgi:hypothetical protein
MFGTRLDGLHRRIATATRRPVSFAIVHALEISLVALGLVVALAPSRALADPPIDSPWGLPPPLPMSAPAAPQPAVVLRVGMSAPASPATRPPRKAWVTFGVMGAFAIPTNGVLGSGGAGLIFGSEEFARRLSARIEAGLRSHGGPAGGGEPQSLLTFNTGLRIYLLYEGMVRPYLGAHFGSVIALGGATAASSGIGLALGGSGGANFPINESLEVGAELRYEAVFPFGGALGYGSSLEGGVVSVMGSFAFILY